MNLDDIMVAVREWANDRSEALGLRHVEVDYVLNWGGFVNHSFRIGDGRPRYHLKLASHPETQFGLRQWRRNAVVLETYQAPPIIDWASLSDIGCEGPLTTWIDGRTPDRVTRSLADRVLPAIARLHGDGELASSISDGADGASSIETCADAFRATFDDRFSQDFIAIERERPPFVSDAELRTMRREIAWFRDAVQRSNAFREPACAPVHGDIWMNNILESVGADGDASGWWLLDWDDLHLGDPVMDFAMIFGPTLSELRGPDCVDAVDPFLTSDAERERFEFYRRASLFDWAVDSLADYIEADAAPQHAVEVRAEKERTYRDAFAAYVSSYHDTRARPGERNE